MLEIKGKKLICNIYQDYCSLFRNVTPILSAHLVFAGVFLETRAKFHSVSPDVLSRAIFRMNTSGIAVGRFDQ